MDRKTLMGLVREMDCDSKYDSFFRFAHNYILRLKSNDGSVVLTDAQIKTKFFNAISEVKRMLEYPRRGAEIESLKKALGFVGKNAPNDCVKWCDVILDIRQKTAAASAEELDYLMGMCARKCKVKDRGIKLYLTDIRR